MIEYIKCYKTKRKKRHCYKCGKEIENYPYLYQQKKFCSWACKSKYMDEDVGQVHFCKR